MILDARDAGAREHDRGDARAPRRRTRARSSPSCWSRCSRSPPSPAANTAEAGGSCAGCGRACARRRRRKGLAIGSAGTHPFAMWEDQRIVARPRYRDLISALRFVARQEIIFGIHVHVGVDDPDKAIHVANGMRVHVPLLLALSANSPFWRADPPGLASTRTPIFRAFPRVGHPAPYDDWDDYAERIDFMVEPGVIEDYTYLWYDVRPHPKFGTVEVRVMDSQTRVEHTLGAGRAGPGAGQGAPPSTSTRASGCRGTRTRCSTRTSGWPRATAWRASSSTCRRASGSRTKRAGAPAARPRSASTRRTWVRRRARGHRRPARTATAPRASSSSTRPTTTSARSMAEIVAATG